MVPAKPALERVDHDGVRLCLLNTFASSSASTCGAGQRQRAGGAQPEEREPEPEALALARAAPQRGEHHAVAGGDLAAGGEELPEALLGLGGHLARAPL